MTTYLDFEEPLKALEEQIEQTKKIGETTDVDMSDKVSELQRKLVAKTKDIFSKLSPWQRVQHFAIQIAPTRLLILML